MSKGGKRVKHEGKKKSACHGIEQQRPCRLHIKKVQEDHRDLSYVLGDQERHTVSETTL